MTFFNPFASPRNNNNNISNNTSQNATPLPQYQGDMNTLNTPPGVNLVMTPSNNDSICTNITNNNHILFSAQIDESRAQRFYYNQMIQNIWK
eukprot:UN06735